ncbi:MAG: SpoIIE family protein phosphatase [Acidobacteriota bacterium]|nr:SpoIIE family protein phosphatase [Acidobacteriota bacterium]
MNLTSYHARRLLIEAGLWPSSKLAMAACYLLGLDVLLFGLERLLGRFRVSFGQSLGFWVTFLSTLVVVLFSVLAFRWAKEKLLWRLRNRLIVTYVFIGVIPVVMLVALALGTAYLLSGQFATFIVTTSLNSELKSLSAANSMLARDIASRLRDGSKPETVMASLQARLKAGDDIETEDRDVRVWVGETQILESGKAGHKTSGATLPPYLKAHFQEVVRDGGRLFLRAVEIVPMGAQKLTVISSEPLDQRFVQELASDLGEITLYASGLTRRKVEKSAVAQVPDTKDKSSATAQSAYKSDGEYVLDTGTGQLNPTYTAGTVPDPVRTLDRGVSFATSVRVVDWETGDSSSPAAISVQTRVSKLYEHLFAALGDFAPAIELSLLVAFVIFAIIELVAILIGTHLTRTVTGSVAQLYDATKHINRGDFTHRIPIRSTDQLSTLANSFNSMTTSLQKLVEEQKEKQRLENEISIAQEVQAQLFPRHIAQLSTLEVHGFCRPARTVSGDYYDFLKLNSERLILAVGDISGKGISAALLMATIHSAVRAYSLENIPVLSESLAVGAGPSSSVLSYSELRGAEVYPGKLLSLLNHQLFESTPMEKYATLFLALYNERERTLTYSNGGHLPPIILGRDGSIRRLDRGGTVVGLFDQVHYEERSVPLGRGDLFLAYSDGVTEPENDFGEFGEERLIELVQQNQDLPLQRITEIVTAAVEDWIGANEQPDDITLVLARAR